MAVAGGLRVDGKVGCAAPIEPCEAIGGLLQRRDGRDGARNDRPVLNDAGTQEPIDGPAGPGIDEVAVTLPFGQIPHAELLQSVARRVWQRLHELRGQSLRRDELLLKLGAAKKEAGRAWHLVDIGLPEAGEAVTPHTFTFALRRDRVRRARRREGRYLLRSNLTGEDPATLWRYYMRLTEIEQAFKEIKHDLAIRPVFHQREERIEAHIFIAFVAYCLHVTLKNLARPRAPGLTPSAILEKFSTMQLVDVHLPTTDGRHLVLPRRTDPTRDHQLLLHQLNLKLPEQPPPRISA